MKNVAALSKNWWHNSKTFYNKAIGGSDYITDRTLWVAIFTLLAAGLVTVYSASYIYAQERFGNGLHFFQKHLTFVVAGLISFFSARKITPHKLYQYAFGILGAAIVLLILTLIPGLNHKAGGASRWLNFGLFYFQPSEFAKLAVIIFVATQLHRKERSPQNWRTSFLAYFMGAIPVYVLLLLQPDFGTTVLLLLTTTLVLIATGVNLRYIFTALGIIIPIGAGLIFSSAYRLARVQAFLDPWKDATGKGFQVIQSLVAVYSGKWFGVGLGNSKEKLFYLPEAHNDFIFAVICEELGIFGIAFFTALFLIIVLHGLKAAMRADNMFQKGFALGVSIMVGLQAFFNMGVVLGLLPTKGLPLPLVSYGGSSLIVTMFMLGMLTQISEKNK